MIIFQKNIEKYKLKISELTKSLKRLSIVRLIVFVTSSILLVYLANEKMISILFVSIPPIIVGFGILINRFNLNKYQKRHAFYLRKINEYEIHKLNNDLSDFEEGRSFIDRDHPYISDLDIFGRYSLFQLLNRTTTETGQLLLADWLSGPASKEEIFERQQSIKELSPEIDWRQNFQATGMHYINKYSDYKKLINWINKPVQLLPHQSKFLVISILLSCLSTLSVVLIVTYTNAIPLVLILLINYLILKKLSPISEDIIDNTHQNLQILGGYKSLILSIDSLQVNSRKLKGLKSVFNQDNYSAAIEINRLEKILNLFKLRGTKSGGSTFNNKFYLIFNIFWLLDVYCIILAERWKIKNRDYLKSWASSVSEFEVLNSLAGFTYSNQNFSFPEIHEEPFYIQFKSVGHPLIQQEKRVYNNFDLHDRGEIALITGSNMAGKSTFLRTIGINMVLALMGAPCCAKTGKVSNMKIFTSMRTQDNLHEGISSFSAELKRMEKLLELIKSGFPIFFLLDELFKGTNSLDRHKGGVSLIKQLSELNAFGIIATHDLELAKLAENHLSIINFNFNSEIQDGEIYFNYKLSKGICKDFNASELMKRSGINILENNFDT